MNQPTTERRRIAVIGGGIAGLAAALRVNELAPTAEVQLFEAGDRVGGIIGTVRQDGLLIETSADSFITNVPWGIDLCRRIGFADQLIPTNSANRGAMVVARGKLQPVPPGFLLMSPERLWPLVRSPILSTSGKLRVACERFVKSRRTEGDESVASFARRRLGREVYQRLVQPLVGGIYTGDPEKLSLSATLPRFGEMERQYGSLIRAGRANRRAGESVSEEISGDAGARYSMFVTAREGLSSFVEALAKKLPTGCVRLRTAVSGIERVGDQWRLEDSRSGAAINNPPHPNPLPRRGEGMEFDAVIVATSPGAAGKLLAPVDAALAGELEGIECAGCAIVDLGYERSQIGHPLNSFGFVVPAIERRRILSASFSSVKFPGRAPEGKELIRVFLGGALQPEMIDLSDNQLRRIAEEELRDLLGISGGACLSMVFRWHASMPQYHLGHLERVRRIEARVSQLRGLALAGNAYQGVGIPHCIRSGELAAERAVGSRAN